MAASQSGAGPHGGAPKAEGLSLGPVSQIAANAAQSVMERVEAIKGLVTNLMETNATVRETIKANSEAVQKHMAICESIATQVDAPDVKERVLNSCAEALDKLFAQNQATRVQMVDHSEKNMQVLGLIAIGAIAIGAAVWSKGRE